MSFFTFNLKKSLISAMLSIATVPTEAITIITESIDLTILCPTARVVERRPFPLRMHVAP